MRSAFFFSSSAAASRSAICASIGIRYSSHSRCKSFSFSSWASTMRRSSASDSSIGRSAPNTRPVVCLMISSSRCTSSLLIFSLSMYASSSLAFASSSKSCSFSSASARSASSSSVVFDASSASSSASSSSIVRTRTVSFALSVSSLLVFESSGLLASARPRAAASAGLSASTRSRNLLGEPSSCASAPCSQTPKTSAAVAKLANPRTPASQMARATAISCASTAAPPASRAISASFAKVDRTEARAARSRAAGNASAVQNDTRLKRSSRLSRTLVADRA
mmetsp:Transcript_13248/g.45838  ORF Transcript_13248/g.45838 Transcript_13248/m.45838 type:complete len:280 (+) Transcript_13248:508-1347(+)